jgi:myo-inositol-1-phosphate synthase
MPEIRVAIAGVGNCASSLVQGIVYYSRKSGDVIGLMHADICGYKPGDIRIVAAFDIDRRKVGSLWKRPSSRPPTARRQ